MKKIIFSLAIIAATAAIVISGTTAFFSDTETSTDNIFTAGAIDLKVDSKCTYNSVSSAECGTWGQNTPGIDITNEKFFNFSDVKPGDTGENTISLHVVNNDAYACVNIIPTKNDDVTTTEPESQVDAANTDSIFDGELAQNLTFKIWADVCAVNATPGDNVYQDNCDKLLTSGASPIVPTTYALATPAGNVFTGNTDPMNGAQTYYLGVEWNIPATVGNIIQTDNYQADISFIVEQARNNASFTCDNAAPAPNSLRLENETIVEGQPWIVLNNDEIYADLTWSDGGTFNYSLTGKGLTANTSYSLIYYADGWPGNNPGALIGSATTDGSGNINLSASPELAMDLPAIGDGNYAVGAKIWLVLSSDYDASSKSMIAWNPGSYLFEGNVYIHYNDTDI